MERFCLKITGESGAGLLSTGEIIAQAFKAMGYYVVGDREYPSLIKGGHSCFILNISSEPIHALSEKVDAMLCIDKQSMEAYYKDLKKGGVMVYGYERPLGVKEIVQEMAEAEVQVVHQMSREIAEAQGGNVLMINIVLAGMLWKTLGLPYEYIEEEVKKKFASKPKILEIDLRCLKAGYESVSELIGIFKPAEGRDVGGELLINGHHALTLGAIHAGCRAYYAYPMSPSSNILTYMADWSGKTGMLVKQVEDEISVVNMALGSMFAGTRTLCATSGGGFDLMTETVSLSGITETPLVVVVAQRPGPGTGLPTWTGQGDLNLAMHGGHGEFARVVVALSDCEDPFELIQHAFNFAEVYQIPVIVLSEKQTGEMIKNVPMFKEKTVPIKRGLVTNEAEVAKLAPSDRYKITESGVSKRWLPGASNSAYYFANGDEHWEDGSLTEEADEAGLMYEKRVRKLKTLANDVPEPEVYGEAGGAEISFVGWGSSLGAVRDIVNWGERNGVKINYLHYRFVWPLKTEKLEKFFNENKNVHLIEGNNTGQFGRLVRQETGLTFAGQLLKWNGRPFFLEDMMEYVNKNRKK